MRPTDCSRHQALCPPLLSLLKFKVRLHFYKLADYGNHYYGRLLHTTNGLISEVIISYFRSLYFRFNVRLTVTLPKMILIFKFSFVEKSIKKAYSLFSIAFLVANKQSPLSFVSSLKENIILLANSFSDCIKCLLDQES